MDVATAQYLCLAGLFLSVLLCCLIPIWLLSAGSSKSRFHLSSYETAVDYANCVSAGVFLATFFLGLLPEVREEIEMLLSQTTYVTQLPVTECTVLLGFFLALFLEQLAIVLKSGGRNESHAHHNDRGQVVPSEDDRSRSGTSGGCGSSNRSSNGGHSHHLQQAVSSSSAEGMAMECNDHAGPSSSFIHDTHVQFQNVCQNHSDHHEHHQHNSSHGHSHNSHGHSHDFGALVSTNSLIRFCMLLLSLSVHSLFEGIWIHECLIAFAVGISISKLHLTRCKVALFAILFSSLLPVGQAIGIVIGIGDSFTSQTVGALLQAIAAGTFIHVTFHEIIPECLSGTSISERLFRVFLIIVGYALISVVTWFTV